MVQTGFARENWRWTLRRYGCAVALNSFQGVDYSVQEDQDWRRTGSTTSDVHPAAKGLARERSRMKIMSGYR